VTGGHVALQSFWLYSGFLAVDSAAGFECNECFSREAHVVYAQDLHALGGCGQRGAGGCLVSVPCFVSKDLA
jgi:hypothetical protein